MHATEFARAGSQRWLQIAVSEAPRLVNDAFRAAGALSADEEADWVSPLPADEFREYRDTAALRQVGLEVLPKRQLEEFWPRGGPVWDAIAKVGQSASIFVEAKAHIAEAASPGSQAGPDSLRKIEAALAEARKYYAPRASAPWHLRFFQYANRLAHHYFLRSVNGCDTRLVFLDFINADDVDGPRTELEWKGATRLLHAALGLPADLTHHRVYHAYIDVRALPSAP